MREGREHMDRKTFLTPEYTTGTEIKKIRKQLGMTQKEFAGFINTSKPTIERWERSENPIIGPIVLLIQMLETYPEFVDTVRVPEKQLPIRLWYMHDQTVCTIIDVNEMKREVKIINYAEHVMFRAFGSEEHPSYEMYLEFLKSRCFPEERDKMKLILNDLNLPFYDPFMIIEKTEGRMAEDHFWIRIER